MAPWLYQTLLLILAIVPVLAAWYFGLRLALIAAAVEIGVVAAAAYIGRQMMPPPPAMPLPQEQVLEHLNRTHAEGLGELIGYVAVAVVVPVMCVLTGCLAACLLIAGRAASQRWGRWRGLT